MTRLKLLVCALLGHSKIKRQCVYARLEIPHADRFVAVICFRCGCIYEDETAVPNIFAPCAAHID